MRDWNGEGIKGKGSNVNTTAAQAHLLMIPPPGLEWSVVNLALTGVGTAKGLIMLPELV